MTLKEARQVRDELRTAGIHSVVPLGYGPDGYFVRIYLGFNEVRKFMILDDARKYIRESESRNERNYKLCRYAE